MTYRFQVGETIKLGLDAVEGDPALATAITASMRLVADATVVIPFTVDFRAAAGVEPAGWTLTIAAAASAELAPGIYRADARIEVGADVVITDPVRVRMVAR